MSLRENLQNVFKPKDVRETEQIVKTEEAFNQERCVTAQYLEGQISLEQYNQELAKTYPLTKLDLRKLASETGGHI